MSELPGFRLSTVSVDMKCDAPGCDHIEPIALDCRDLIGKRCPKCNSDLLTKEDYEAFQKLMAGIEIANQILPIPEDAETVSGPRISINPHAGALNIRMATQRTPT